MHQWAKESQAFFKELMILIIRVRYNFRSEEIYQSGYIYPDIIKPRMEQDQNRYS
jgi:hypothetical protein